MVHLFLYHDEMKDLDTVLIVLNERFFNERIPRRYSKDLKSVIKAISVQTVMAERPSARISEKFVACSLL